MFYFWFSEKEHLDRRQQGKGTNIVLVDGKLIPYTFCQSKQHRDEKRPACPSSPYNDYRLLAVSEDYTDMSYHDRLTHEGRVLLCKLKQDKSYDRLLALALGQNKNCLSSIFRAHGHDVYTQQKQINNDYWQALYIATTVTEKPLIKRSRALFLPFHPN